MSGESASRASERAHWEQSLQSQVGAQLELAGSGDGSAPRIRRVIVLDETASTQDAEETRSAESGTVITALRQSSGRGRLGRSWSDPHGEGVAMTAVLPSRPFAAPEQSVELLALASAVAASRAVESMLREPVGIKWPNDLIVRGRKLGGILIEKSRDRILLGIGVNVLQRSFPPELESIATSMFLVANTQSTVTRLDVVRSVLAELERVLVLSADAILYEYATRDVLSGSVAAFATSMGTIEGEVCSVDPLRGLTVRNGSGAHFLPAATTTVCSWKSRSSM